MLNNKKAVLLILLLISILYYFEYIPQKKFLACVRGISCSSVLMENGSELFVSNTEDTARTYSDASQSCRARKMRLPSREEAWTLWINSTNCQKAFKGGPEIIKDKETFLKGCHREMMNHSTACSAPAKKVLYKCVAEPKLTFADDSYRYGNYWLNERYDYRGHYTVSYISGITNAYDDRFKLGTRCVAVGGK